MKNFKKNAVLISLVGMLCSNIMGCASNTDTVIDQYSIQSEYNSEEDDASKYLLNVDDANKEVGAVDNEELEEEIAEEIAEEEDDNVLYQNDTVSVISVPVVIATANVNIRDSIEGEILGVLPEGHNLELLEKVNDTHYKVLYYGQEAYISANYAMESLVCDVNSDIIKMFYASEDKTIIIPSFLSESGEDEEKHIDKYECFEVYEELDDSYLVQTADYVGYITKDDLVELNGTYVIIDISDQNLKCYENYGIVVDTPVITGKPGTSTPVGQFAIFEVTHDRYLIGKNNSYRSWVSIMMNFNGNIGLHDAEYHTDEDGFHHGWRATNIFGGKTYLTNGSHGCVNMRYDDVMTVYAHTEIGTIVLVKK